MSVPACAGRQMQTLTPQDAMQYALHHAVMASLKFMLQCDALREHARVVQKLPVRVVRRPGPAYLIRTRCPVG